MIASSCRFTGLSKLFTRLQRSGITDNVESFHEWKAAFASRLVEPSCLVWVPPTVWVGHWLPESCLLLPTLVCHRHVGNCESVIISWNCSDGICLFVPWTGYCIDSTVIVMALWPWLTHSRPGHGSTHTHTHNPKGNREGFHFQYLCVCSNPWNNSIDKIN